MSKCKKLPEWDLSEYYNGVDDPQIQKDLDLFDRKAKDFVKKYRGRVRDLDATELLKLFKAKEDMRRISVCPCRFSSVYYFYYTRKPFV